MSLGHYSILMWWGGILYVSPLTYWSNHAPPALLLSLRKSGWICDHHLYLFKINKCLVIAPGLMNQTLSTTWRVMDTRWISTGGERPLGVGECRPAAEIESGITSNPNSDEAAAAASHKYEDFTSNRILYTWRGSKNIFMIS